MKTNIWKFKNGLIIDPTKNKDNPLIWNEKRNLWERINAPIKKYDLTEAVEMTAEDLVKARLVKVTPFEDEKPTPEDTGEIIP